MNTLNEYISIPFLRVLHGFVYEYGRQVENIVRNYNYIEKHKWKANLNVLEIQEE